MWIMGIGILEWTSWYGYIENRNMLVGDILDLALTVSSSV